MMKIKICGLKQEEHAIAAAELGADYLGFVFAESPRRVTPEQVQKIICKLPSSVLKVGVFLNQEPEEINSIISYCGLDFAQLHGNETSEHCRKVSGPVIKVIRIKDEHSLEQMEVYRNVVDIFLLDTYVQGISGGTGKTFKWPLAARASKYGKIILAGGLTPENVNTAISQAEPYAVDVSSGVETDRIKDPAKIEAFIRRVRGNQHVHAAG